MSTTTKTKFDGNVLAYRGHITPGKPVMAEVEHRQAQKRSDAYAGGFSSGMRDMLNGWHNYALAHKTRFDSLIGNDCVLGKEWESIGDALRGLLNGETGGFDAGSLDSNILDCMEANGVDISTK